MFGYCILLESWLTLRPRKGTIAVGCRAAMVEFDPDAVISDWTRYLNADHIQYDGVIVKDLSKVVDANGRVLIKDGKRAGIPTTRRPHCAARNEPAQRLSKREETSNAPVWFAWTICISVKRRNGNTWPATTDG